MCVGRKGNLSFLPNTHTPSLTTNLSSRLICLYSGGSVFVVCCVMRANTNTNTNHLLTDSVSGPYFCM